MFCRDGFKYMMEREQKVIMKASENHFLTFLDGKKQFIIPIYQRPYSWKPEHCERLWNDIVRTATDKQGTKHFVGSIVYILHGLVIAGGVCHC